MSASEDGTNRLMLLTDDGHRALPQPGAFDAQHALQTQAL
jgi:hypothetical protein